VGVHEAIVIEILGHDAIPTEVLDAVVSTLLAEFNSPNGAFHKLR